MVNAQIIGYNNDEYTVEAGSLTRVSVVQDAIKPNRGRLRTQNISYPHHELHGGNMFEHSYVFPAVADSGDGQIVVHTGTKHWHMFSQFGGEGAAYVRLYEGTIPHSGTAATTSHNLNRASSKTSSGSVYNDVYVDAAEYGTELHQGHIAGGAGPKSAGGTIRQNTEWILSSGTHYLFRLTNDAAATKMYTAELEWYEESP